MTLLAGLVLLATELRAQIVAVCWYEETGRRECGDSVPARYAHSDREYLNAQGVVVRRERGALSDDERAAIEAEQRAREAREIEARERARYGQVLLDSYTSVEAIEILRDRNMKALDGQISRIEGYLDDLNRKLDELNRTSQRYLPYSDRENAQPLPRNIALDIELTKSSIAMFEKQLEEKRIEKDATLEDFEKDIAYFKELQALAG